MNTRLALIAGAIAGASATILLVVLITLALATPRPVTPAFIAGATASILLGLTAVTLVRTAALGDRAERRGYELGKVEGFEQGYNHGWVEGAALARPRNVGARVTPLRGVHQRAN